MKTSKQSLAAHKAVKTRQHLKIDRTAAANKAWVTRKFQEKV